MQRLVTYPELKRVCGIPYSPQHILRLQKPGRFPLSRKLGNFNFWKAEDIDAWISKLPVRQLDLPEGE